MMGSYNFGAASDKSLKELNETIKENSKVTSEQNEKLVNYTRWLFVLTIALGVIALMQLVTVLVLNS
jgi:hypothetical protein